MFKPLLCSMITAAAITFACPAFAGSVTYQLSVTIPPHAMPVKVEPTGIGKTAPQAQFAQTVQKEQVVRNERKVTVQSIVVL